MTSTVIPEGVLSLYDMVYFKCGDVYVYITIGSVGHVIMYTPVWEVRRVVVVGRGEGRGAQ